MIKKHSSGKKYTETLFSLLLFLFLFSGGANAYSAPEAPEFYRDAFAGTGVPVLVIDPETHYIKDANRAALDFYGYSMEEITSMVIGDINTMSAGEIEKEMEAAKKAERNHFVFKHRLSDDTIKTVEVYSWPVSTGGRTLLFSIIHDITEKYLLEQKIVRSEKEHREAEIFAGVGHWIFDVASQTMTASKGARAIYGIHEGDAPLEVIRNTALPEYRDMLDKALKDLIAEGKEYDVVFKVKNRVDGRIIDVRSAAKYDSETGKVFGIINDITEAASANELLRKRTARFISLLALILVLQLAAILLAWRSLLRRKKAEKELLAKTTELENFFDLTIDLFCIMDFSGMLIKVNREWEKVTGYKYHKFEGKIIYDFLHPDDREKTIRAVKDISEGNAVKKFTNRVLTREGQARILEWQASPHGNLVYAVARDITEKEAAEQAVRKRENLLGKIFEVLPVGLWITDREGRLISGNPAGIKIWGAEKKVGIDEYGVFRAWRLPSGEEIKPDEWALAKTIREGVTIKSELLEIEGFDREKRTILNSTAPVLDNDGNVDGAIVVNQDITEVKKMEEERIKLERQIQQTQKLESLGILAGGIAHDFNNILMAVLGHSELALDELSPSSPARRNIKEIEVASRRAAELCRQMLAYSGKATFFMEKVDLREMIEEMLHLLKTSISKKAILNLNLEKGLPPILADPSQIRQVLMNLIINASDAIDQRSGVITISLGAVKCGNDYLSSTELYEGLEPGLYVYIEVADTGCGMDSETVKHVFEPFYTTKFAGRGLGLAAVLGIVKAHKGSIQVYSELNKGTTFKLLFPAVTDNTGKSHDRPGEYELQEWKGSGVILIADDEESLRALGSSMLEHLGFKVLTASDGKEAVEIYTTYPGKIDVVILDLTMPHMDGSQALSELKRVDPEIKVVIASGYNKDDVCARFAGKNLCGVLQKPYSISKLREVLSGIIGTDEKR